MICQQHQIARHLHLLLLVTSPDSSDVKVGRVCSPTGKAMHATETTQRRIEKI